MPGDGYLLAAALVAFAVTLSLRAAPFVLVGPLRRSAMVRYLGLHMPAGVMVILAVYTLREVPLRAWPHGLPEAAALAVTVALHLWRRNAVVSILAGTFAYVALTSWVFT